MESRKLNFLLCFTGIFLGCGGGDDEPGPDPEQVDAAVVVPDAAPVDAEVVPPDASALALLEVTVEYDGAATGTLIVAGFASFPPQGPPSAFAQDATPAWPQTLTLGDLEAGTIYAFAMLDAPPSSPTQPGPEDRTAFSKELTLVAGDTTQVILTLSDPKEE